MNDPGPYPYVGKTITEVIHDYAVTRGDLSEPYAREQLVDLIERRIAEAHREGATEAWDEGAEATAEWIANNPGPSGVPADPPRNPYAAALRGDA